MIFASLGCDRQNVSCCYSHSPGMASRSKSRTATPVEAQPQVSSTNNRPVTPASQVLPSRQEEKRHLQVLNDRLAHYIETVRSLEAENEVLLNRSQAFEDNCSKDVQNVRSVYEKQLSETRDELEKTLREKVGLEAELGSERSAREDLTARLSKRDKELAALRKELTAMDKELKAVRAALSDDQSKLKRVEDEKHELVRDLDDVRKRLSSIQKELSNEAALRLDAEHKLQSAQQQLSIEKQLLEEELNSSHAQKLELETSMTRQFQDQLQQRLGDELIGLREEHEEKLRSCRADLEARYEAEVAQLKDRLKQRSGAENKLRSDLQTLTTKSDALESQVKHYEGMNKSLNERVKDLEKLLEQERKWHENALQEKEKELNALQEKIKDNMKEYQDLHDVKVALDFEIDAYHKLLDGEESRLSIGSTDRPLSRASTSSTPMRGKRKAIQEIFEDEYHSTSFNTEGHTTSDVEINDHDAEGNYVQVLNKGEKEIPLAGWQLIRNAANNPQPTTYKFHRNIVIKPGAKITIWSSNVKGKTNNPPSDLVMKNHNWTTAPEMTTSLLDADGTVSHTVSNVFLTNFLFILSDRKLRGVRRRSGPTNAA